MNRVIIILILLISISISSISHAHPMGIKLWGHRTDVTLKDAAIEVDYTIEIPMTKLFFMMEQYKGSKGKTSMSPADEEAFRNGLIEYLASGLTAYSNGRKLGLRWNDDYPKNSNDGDPGFFEYHVHLIADVEDKTAEIEVKNDNYPIQRAVFLNNVIDTNSAHSNYLGKSNDPDWSNDESSRSLKFLYTKGAATERPSTQEEENASSQHSDRESLLFKHLKRQDLSPEAVSIALLIALALGALHALSPGHGKALVAAYLVGNEGTVGQALLLGMTVTITHVLSVFIFGIAGLLLARFILPEYYMPFISLAAGLIVVSIGARLFIGKLSSHKKNTFHTHHHDHHKHDEPKRSGLKNLLVLGATGGAAPCPTAMAVMLTAIAIGRTAFGLAIISAFSIGLAAVLTAIGIAMVKAKSFASKSWRFDKASRYFPIISALIVTILGMAIIYEGFIIPWLSIR